MVSIQTFFKALTFFILFQIAWPLSSDEIQQWSSNLATEFHKIAIDYMRLPNIQQIFDKASHDVVQNSGRVAAASSAAKVSAYFEDKKNILRVMTIAVKEAMSAVSDDSIPPTPVERTGSSFPFPYSQHEQDRDAYDTKDLKSTFTSAINVDDDIVNGYFVSATGVLRTSANNYNLKNFSETFEQQTGPDLRLTPWYANAVAGPKDISILVDSRTFYSHKKTVNLKISLRNLVRTISSADMVSIFIVEVSETPRLVNPMAINGCSNYESFRGTETLKSKLLSLLESPLFAFRNSTAFDQNVNKNATASSWTIGIREAFALLATIRKKGETRAASVVIFAAKSDVFTVREIAASSLEGNGGIPVHTYKLDESEEASAIRSKISICSDLGPVQSIYSPESAVKPGHMFSLLFRTTEPLVAQPSLLLKSGLDGLDKTMTMVGAVYSDKDSSSGERKLLGVVGFDFKLSKLKEILDNISDNLGKYSFPVLLTPAGETIYHMLQNVYLQKEPIDLGRDISNYEYFPEFSNLVREPCLRGEIGSQSAIIKRAIPAGDVNTEGFKGITLHTSYFYTPVASNDLRLLLVFDELDLNSVNYEAPAESFLLTSHLYNFEDSKLGEYTSKIPDFELINKDNCNAFTNCMPDEYCERVLHNISHPVGVVPGAPRCVQSSVCKCESHRWPVGLISRTFSAIHMNPKSVKDGLMLYNMDDFDSSLTERFVQYINDMEHASNPPPYVRSKAKGGIRVSAAVNALWINDVKRGIHNNTLWLYFGSSTGYGLFYPANYWGRTWDPTRRPWYNRAISNPETYLTISTPYKDAGGAGLITTLSSIIWGPIQNGRKKIEGVTGYDFLFPVMNNFLPASTNCSTFPARSSKRHTACFLIDGSGLLLIHSDFLLSAAEKEKVQNSIGNNDGGQWASGNVFLGAKEPDLANALVHANIIKYIQNEKSPDTKTKINYYKVNKQAFNGSNVLRGKLEAPLNCLDGSTATEWYITTINGTNAYLVVAENYLRNLEECVNIVQAQPPEPISISQCEVIKQETTRFFERSKSYQMTTNICENCTPGSYRNTTRTPCKQCNPGSASALSTSAKCELCPSGKFSALYGGSECISCSFGQYSFDTGGSNFDSCKSCPMGAYCPGEDKIEALIRLTAESERPDKPLKRTSYWRVSNKSSVFYTCPMPEGCRGTTMCPLVKIDDGMDKSDRADFIAQRCATTDVSSSETVCPDKRCLAFLPNKKGLKCHQNEVDTTRGECVVDRKLEECAEGYNGPLCSSCVAGYGKSGGKCEKCPDPILGIFLGTLGVLLLFFTYSYLIYATMKQHGLMDKSTVVCRIIVSNFLVLSVFQAIPINWAPELYWYFDVGDAATTPPINIDCLLKAGLGNNFTLVKPLIYLLLPVFWSIVLGIFWFCKYQHHLRVIKKEHGQRAATGNSVYSASLDVLLAQRMTSIVREVDRKKKGKKDLVSLDAIVTFMDKYIGSLVVLQYMLLPNAVRQTFAYIDCGRLNPDMPPVTELQMQKYYEDPDTYVLSNPDPRLFIRDNLGIQCYDEDHEKWLAFVFAPSVLIYCIGIPLWWFVLLVRHRKSVFSLPVSRIKLGFITGGYEPQYWYWELICQFRKTLLIGVSVFFSSFPPIVPTTMSAVILVFSLFLQMEAMPFEDNTLDYLEKYSLLTGLVTLLLGVFFNVDSIASWGLVILVLIIFAFNGAFLYLAGRKFLRENWAELLRDNTSLQKRYGKKNKERIKIVPSKKRLMLDRANDAWDLQ